MFINEKKHTIELSKKEAKAAAKFGTTEYKNLQEARRDYPTFSVKTVSQKPATKKNTFKGLTYEYMESYISKHDDENSSIMEAYMTLRGISDDAEEAFAESCSYFEIKTWFLNQYPAIAEFHKKREALLNKKSA